MAEYKVEVLMGGDLENVNLQLYGVHELLQQWGATPKVDDVASWGHDVELYDYNDDGDEDAELHTFSVLVEIPDDIDFTELQEQLNVTIFEEMPETFPNIMDVFILDVFVDMGSEPNPMRESDAGPRPSRQTKMSQEQLLTEIRKLIEYYSTTADCDSAWALLDDLRDLVYGFRDKPMREGKEKEKVSNEEIQRLTSKLKSDKPLTPDDLETIEKGIIPELPFATRMIMKAMLKVHKKASAAEKR